MGSLASPFYGVERPDVACVVTAAGTKQVPRLRRIARKRATPASLGMTGVNLGATDVSLRSPSPKGLSCRVLFRYLGHLGLSDFSGHHTGGYLGEVSNEY